MASYHLITSFADPEAAERAYRALEQAGIETARLSIVSREESEAELQAEEKTESEELPPTVAKKVVAGGVAGTFVGGATGFLAGALAFSIPGVGPVVGTGLLAATLGGAVAGATAGGVMGGIGELWDARTRDVLREGGVILAVHDADDQIARRAEEVLAAQGAERVDRIVDERGDIVLPDEPVGSRHTP